MPLFRIQEILFNCFHRPLFHYMSYWTAKLNHSHSCVFATPPLPAYSNRASCYSLYASLSTLAFLPFLALAPCPPPHPLSILRNRIASARAPPPSLVRCPFGFVLYRFRFHFVFLLIWPLLLLSVCITAPVVCVCCFFLKRQCRPCCPMSHHAVSWVFPHSCVARVLSVCMYDIPCIAHSTKIGDTHCMRNKIVKCEIYLLASSTTFRIARAARLSLSLPFFAVARALRLYLFHRIGAKQLTYIGNLVLFGFCSASSLQCEINRAPTESPSDVEKISHIHHIKHMQHDHHEHTHTEANL